MMKTVRQILRSFFPPLGNRLPASRRGLPRTFEPVPTDARMTRPKLFDPALKQFTQGYRLGEPAFGENAELMTRWRRSRRRAMEHLLRAVAQSPLADHLVLRGSLLLRAWLGEAAREPGDMDWVVIPRTIHVSDRWKTELFKDLAARIAAHPDAGEGVTIEIDRLAVDDIWTYERAPGQRVVFPFTCAGEPGSQPLPAGVVQMDFVFCEPMPDQPVQSEIPLLDGSALTVQTASRAQSLAWKILWLESDAYPQGKDLYDATLIAEQTSISHELLEQTFRAAGPMIDRMPKLSADMPLKWEIDWDSFRKEYPQVEGDADTWKGRLARALSHTLPPASRD